jgi:hypothetical protein
VGGGSRDNKDLLAFAEHSIGIASLWGDDRQLQLSFAKYIMPPAEVLAKPWDMVGYEWCVEHWGSKWPATDIDLDVVWTHDLRTLAKRHAELTPLLARIPQLAHGEYKT